MAKVQSTPEMEVARAALNKSLTLVDRAMKQVTSDIMPMLSKQESVNLFIEFQTALLLRVVAMWGFTDANAQLLVTQIREMLDDIAKLQRKN